VSVLTCPYVVSLCTLAEGFSIKCTLALGALSVHSKYFSHIDISSGGSGGSEEWPKFSVDNQNYNVRGYYTSVETWLLITTCVVAHFRRNPLLPLPSLPPLAGETTAARSRMPFEVWVGMWRAYVTKPRRVLVRACFAYTKTNDTA
jgi:hypothetical protein